MPLGSLYVLLGEVSVQVLCPLFNWIVCLPGVESYEFFLYFGDQTLVQGIVSKYVFPCSWFPFFADVFFGHEKLFNLIYSHLFTLSFFSLDLKDVLAKILLCGLSEILLPMFFSRTFMVLCLMFKSFIHFEFILV